MVAGSFSFELLKLRKRPATWVLALVMVLLVTLFGYFLSYVFIVGIGGDPPPEARQFLPRLYPESFISQVLGLFSGGIGAALALVLGALTVGSEYGWDTLKVALTQRPGRLSLFSGKLLALGVVLAVFALLTFLAGALSSYVIAGLQDGPVEWPPLWETVRAFGAGWLILAVFAALGVFLATLFRGTALAISLGLVYLLILENLLLGIPTQNEAFQAVGKALPGRNALDLTGSFEEGPPAFEPPGGVVEPTQAVLVLAAYTAIFLLLAMLLFRRRDVA